MVHHKPFPKSVSQESMFIMKKFQTGKLRSWQLWNLMNHYNSKSKQSLFLNMDKISKISL